MNKEEKQTQEVNPFKAFTVLKGEFQAPEGIESEFENIKTGKEGTVVENENQVIDEIPVIEPKKTTKLKKEDKVETTKIKPPTDEVIEEEDSEELEETEEQDKVSFKPFIKDLYNKGVLDIDGSEADFEDSEEGFAKGVNKTVENKINKWVESKHPDTIKFIEFTDNGGKPEDFLNVYYGKHTWKGFNIETEANQKAVIAESLRLSEYNEEDINDMITEWVDNGTLEKRAKSALPMVEKHEDKQKENILNLAKAEREKQTKANESYWNSFKDDLYKKEKLKGFNLTSKDKDDLWNFMTAIDRRSGKTAYQEATESDPEASLLFAYMAMSKFDTSKLKKQVKTEVSKEMGNMLKNYSKDSKTKLSSGKTNEEYETNPFEAFKKLI